MSLVAAGPGKRRPVSGGGVSGGLVVSAVGIGVRFGEFPALRDVTFDVAAGERLAIIGPNGAGKSTLFNVLTGRINPSAGTVALLGHDVTTARPPAVVTLGVGRSFQQASVFVDFTVLENLQFALLAAHGETTRPWGRTVTRHRAAAQDLADSVGIGSMVARPAGQLSHGDERALELALALACSPEVLFLDEPTAGMAPDETRKAMTLVRRLADEQGLTLVFTEHDMEVVFGVAQRVLVLAEGQLVFDGSPAEARASDLVKKVYLGDD